MLENADTQLVNATTNQNELLIQYLQEASICEELLVEKHFYPSVQYMVYKKSFIV